MICLNNNDCSDESSSSRRPRYELKVEALSSEEWSYLRGLFLTDGSCYIGRGANRGRYEVRFSLDGRFEEELALRIAELLRRAGLNPFTVRDSVRHSICVCVHSKALAAFFPNKRVLSVEGVEGGKRFLKENRLLGSVDLGVAFVAGLLDGDGRCRVSVRTAGGSVIAVSQSWSFSQVSYPFLADYVERFVESLASGGVHRGVYDDSGLVEVYIRKCGKEALLDAGIAKYSWKVTRCLSKVAEAEGRCFRYYTAKGAARMLGVNPQTVNKWLRTGEMRYIKEKCREGVGDRRALWFRIPVEEVERFKEKLRQQEEAAVKAEAAGDVVKLVDAARILSVSLNTLHDWSLTGRIQTKMVHRVGRRGLGRYLVVSKEEVERLRDEPNKKR